MNCLRDERALDTGLAEANCFGQSNMIHHLMLNVWPLYNLSIPERSVNLHYGVRNWLFKILPFNANSDSFTMILVLE